MEGMTQGMLKLPWMSAGFVLPGSLWPSCQLGKCKSEPAEPNIGFHTSHVCAPELSVLSQADKESFQLHWDTCLQPALSEELPLSPMLI